MNSSLPPIKVEGRTVILVDDGLATGSSMLVAVRVKTKIPTPLATITAHRAQTVN